MGIVDKAKKAAALGGAVATAYHIAIKVEGAPVRERDKPAAVRVFGLPFFTRDEALERTLFGIPIGKRRK